MKLTDPVTAIKGVGKKTEELLEGMGVYTVGDILSSFPRDYREMPAPSKVADAKGPAAAILARVLKSPVTRKGRRMIVTTATASDGKKEIELVWFRMPYVKSMLTPGKNQIFYGRINKRGNKLIMEQPVIYEVEAYGELSGRLVPVYTVTKGISNHFMQKTIGQVLKDASLYPEEAYADDFRERNQLLLWEDAIRAIHDPADMDGLIAARRRLAFDEFFCFLLAMQRLKKSGEREKNGFSFSEEDFIDSLVKKLPYPLTKAQERALRDAVSDMTSPHLMQRLLQGDVGSGKTILAFLLMSWCAENGYQSAIMAPTEVLAKQHYETFLSNMEMLGLSYPVILLTGSMTAKEKRLAYERMTSEKNAMIIGTHALIQEKAVYQELALVITDEQHRFGVKQREALSKKGNLPHILVMSATPIPRTLAIILYGDLDISVMDELPARRLPIKNCVVGTGYRPVAYQFLQKEIEKGHQAYVICPLVEESESTDAENVTDYADKLSEALGEKVRIRSLHGKMKAVEKDRIMEAFLKREIDILVSTTVIEVGVNVPNATVMMVENAERFGLAQLHQLRGRVGRGDAQSYCIFVNGNDANPDNERLEILNHSNDGFYIASEDLKLRGPGDFLGIRQSGILDFRVADIYQDAALLSLASAEVKDILAADPDLTAPEHQRIREDADRYLHIQLERLNI